jgi:alpha-L-fucosidase
MDSTTAHPFPAASSALSRDERMAWWREARFGLFIHWGVYSVPAGTYCGQTSDISCEWLMHRFRIPVQEYRRYALEFNPVAYDPDALVRDAKAAGVKYIVLTAKHHDGFALFETKTSDWNVVEASPWGRDLVKPLAEACRRAGLRFGLYYSQAQDWINGGSAVGGHWDAAQHTPMADYVENVALPQLRELLTNCGPDVPSVIFWDTPTGMTAELSDRMANLVRSLAPNALTNSRLGPGHHGDFDCPEGFIPASKPAGTDWEVCMTMNNSWGYTRHDTNWKTPATVVRQLCETVAKGGNYLLNLGPQADGAIPPPAADIFRELGRWMSLHSSSIYGTQAGPFPYRMPWGFSSRLGNTHYLFIFDWPADGIIRVPVRNPVAHAWLLSAPAATLSSHADGDSLVLLGPALAPDLSVSVIGVELIGEPVLGTLPPPLPPPLIPQTADGSLALAADDAGLVGNAIGLARGLIAGWNSTEAFAFWRVEVKRAGRFRVELAYGVADSHAGSTLRLSSGGSHCDFVVTSTGHWKVHETRTIGEIELTQAGATEVRLEQVKQATPGSVGDLRSLVLHPLPAA